MCYLQLLVTQLLRMRYLSLSGLALAEATAAVLAMLAAVPVAGLSGEDPLMDWLGGAGEAIVADVGTLLAVLGRSTPSHTNAA